MYEITTYSRSQVHSRRSFGNEHNARNMFSNAVKGATEHGVDRVILEKRAFGRTTILENWKSDNGVACRVACGPQYNRQPYRVSFKRDGSTGSTVFENRWAAEQAFDKLKRDDTVLSAKLQQRVEDGTIERFGRERPRFKTTTLDEYRQLTLAEKIEDGYGYKVHGFDTVLNPKRSAQTAKWYKSEEAAMAAAEQMARRSSGALVVYKAAYIVERDAINKVI